MCNQKRKLKCFYISLFVLNAFSQLAGTTGIFLRMRLIDSVAEHAGEREAAANVMLVVAMILAQHVFLLSARWAELRLTKKYKFHTGELVADACSKLPLSEIEKQHTQETIYKSREFFSKSLELTDAYIGFCEFFLLLFSLFFILARIQPAILWFFCTVIGLALFFSFLSSKNTFGFWSRYMAAARRYNYFSDVQTKREFAYERRIYRTSGAMDERFSEAFDDARKVNRKNGRNRFKGQAAAAGIAVAVSVFTMLYFAQPDILQGMTVGAYAGVTEVVARLLQSVSSCPEGIFSIREVRTLKAELEKFLAKQTEFRPGNHRLVRTESERDAVVFETISFCYPPKFDVKIISDFSFSFKKGRHYGIVGVNGAGKTTLAKLLLGLYPPSEGNTVLSVSSFSAVFQDFQIYPVTIREYLKMGNKDTLGDEEMLYVLSELGCTDFKDGLDTSLSLLTGAGTLLSKGQLQRLAIARVCLSESECILLDEPTASLDPISEKQIYDKCMDLLKDKTCIFISHRLGAVRNMDEILVISGGKMCEHGTHDELIALDGVYKELYLTQREMYINEGTF